MEIDSRSATPCRVRRRVLLRKDMTESRTFSHLCSAKSASMSRFDQSTMRYSIYYPPSQVRPEARLDIKARTFWSRGETAFFDVFFTHVNSTCNQNKSTELIFVEHENEKKRKYQQRVIDVEMGSFVPLVFGRNGGMGENANFF